MIGADARVAIKPHPREPFKERYAAMASARGAAYTESLGVHDAIARGMVVATSSDTLAWLAMAGETPIVSLNVRSYTETGAVHDGHEPSRLALALRAALAERRQELPTSTRERRRALLARYARMRCFSADPALNALGAPSVDDAAERLAGESARADGRCDVGAWLDALRTAGL